MFAFIDLQPVARYNPCGGLAIDWNATEQNTSSKQYMQQRKPRRYTYYGYVT